MERSWLICSVILFGASLVDYTSVLAQTGGDNFPPIFDFPFYFMNIPENSPNGTFVTKTTATDEEGDAIEYFIPENSIGSGQFVIGISNGEVRVAENPSPELDRESEDLIALIVYVRDHESRNSLLGDLSSATVYISLLDSNDNSPSFVNPQESINILENINVESVIAVFEATDPDAGLNGRVAYSIAGDVRIPFRIGAASGELVVDEELDYDEEPRRYDFSLKAEDKANGSMSSFHRVTVNLMDFDDLPPAFTESSYTGEVVENATNGTLIRTVSAFDQDRGLDYSIVYSIESVLDEDSNPVLDYPFEIDNVTGDITKEGPLDHEDSSMFTIFVKATENSSSSRTQTVEVLVTVQDINDNPPVFQVLTYNRNVSEDSPVGTTILTVSADDADGMHHDDFEYKILQGNDSAYFSIDSSSGAVTLSQKVDFESKERHSFTVQAIETIGSKTLFGTAEVNIRVINTNDESPMFVDVDNYMYDLTERKAAFVDYSIYTVLARDRDEPPFVSLTYSLRNNTDKFSINESTGEISVNGVIDYDSGVTAYFLQIEASDGVRMVSAFFRVNVVPINDNPPEIQRDQDFSAIINVTETTDPSIILSDVELRAIDADLPGDDLCWSIVGGDADRFELVSPSVDTTQIMTTKVLDYEEKHMFMLEVTVTDCMSECNGRNITNEICFRDEITLTINVIDLNDNAPVFTEDSYNFTISEQNDPNILIGCVNVTDSDSEADITFSLTEDGDSRFRIEGNGKDGCVYSLSQIDRDAEFSSNPGVITLTVEALDVHSNRLNAIAQKAVTDVQVLIMDINDNYPQFTEQSYQVSFVENNFTVYQDIMASDEDADNNGQLTYRIVSGHMFDNDTHFEIETLENGYGRLKPKRDLNRESMEYYNLVLEASDMGSDPKSTTVNVTVTVTDINDNSPQFTMDSFLGQIRENASVDTVAVTVNATDMDKGINQEIRYFFVVNNEHSVTSEFLVFRINQQTGEVRLRDRLDREDQQTYILQVAAVDGGETPRSATASVTICVTDVNDHSPRFSLTNRNIQVKENVMPGEVLFTETATDNDFISDTADCPDVPENYQLTYKLNFMDEDFSDVFEVNDTSGAVSTKKELDYESRTFYIFKVEAADNNGEGNIGELVVNVIVEPFNDFTPEFDQSQYNITVREDTAPGTTFELLSANDNDLGNNDGTVRYRGNYSDLFEITQSGNFRVLKALDREDGALIIFEAFAYDLGVPSLTTSVNVLVQIEDVNDNAPVFQNLPYTAAIDENSNEGERITSFQILAIDEDEGSNKIVSYSLEDDFSGLFWIDPSNGDLFVNDTLDAEASLSYHLIVIAEDQGEPPQSSTADIWISVNDVNEHAPVPDMDARVAAIFEESMVERILFTVTANDEDVNKSTNGLIGFELGGTDATYFAINQQGVVSYHGNQSVDRDSGITELMFMVIVFDFGQPMSMSSSVAVTVTVTDINDNSPKFQRSNYGSIPVEENYKGNVMNGNTPVVVSATDRDVGGNSAIIYSLLSYSGVFEINETSGELSVIGNLDFETGTRVYLLNISATDQGNPSRQDFAVITITVTDIIDTPPIFNMPTYSVNMFENAGSGDTVLSFNITDPDTGDFLTFTSSDSRFEVANGPPGEHVLVVTQDNAFDYEGSERVISFDIDVQDTALLQNTARISISILDFNDNSPMFSRDSISQELTAGFPEMTSFINVVAQDPDSGPNGNITYTISPANTSLFAVDNAGNVYTTGEIIYRENLVYEFEVVATDNGDEPLSDTIAVSVRINADNAAAPSFSQDSYSGNITENKESGTLVLEVSATDMEGSAIMYEFVDPSVPFSFRDNVIYTNRMLDRETQSLHTFTIRATDGGNPPRFAIAVVVVNVIDENDNVPVFSRETYNFNLRENPTIDEEVGTIATTDRDVGVNAEVSYVVDDGRFQIDEEGVITVASIPSMNDFDKEQVDSITITVTARDKGDGSDSATATVMINLLDVNDNAPVFTMAEYMGSIQEDSDEENLVAEVDAADPDTVGTFSYSIESGDDTDDPKFYISEEGIIRTTDANKKLDREMVAEYHLIVVARDTNNMANSATVIVTVLDKNDETPTFSHPNPYTINRDETYSITNPVLIVTLTANDLDIGTNGDITYSISDDPTGLFRFNNPSVGALSAACCLDRENADYQIGDFAIYSIVVTATDNGQPAQLSSDLRVTINVSDVNDEKPTFQQPSYMVAVSETVDIDYTVAQIIANDPDLGSNGQVTYRFVASSSMFRISSSTGVVTVTSSIRMSDTGRSEYQLTVVASDRGQPVLSNTVSLIITILDENDNAPRFDTSFVVWLVPEETASGSIIGALTATDRDTVDMLNYEVVGGDQLFDTHPNGSVYLLAMLDRETTPIHDIFLVVDDGGDDPQYATATVQVIVQDFNDEQPTFDSSNYEAEVVEGARAGEVVIIITATDMDNGLNGLIRYSLSGMGANNFAVSGDNIGIIIVSNTANLDYEMEPSFVLTLTATDGGISPLSSTTTLTINVININDNIPIFSPQVFTRNISENLYSNETVPLPESLITATDKDGDMLAYDIVSGGNNKFTIDRDSGQISVIAELDRETTSFYQLTVTASDTENRGTAMVQVFIQDVNDNAPEFSRSVYRGTILEGDSGSQRIATVLASDRDTGSNADISFDLLNGGRLFDISTNGEVFSTASASFDREMIATYKLMALAMDNGSPRRTSTAEVIVTVIDVNDEMPYFDQSEYTVDVRVPQDPGFEIAQLMANDEDSGLNSRLSYMLSGNRYSMVIDVNTGLITASGMLGENLINITGLLTVYATDGGSPSLTGTTSLLINFIAKDDPRPNFIQNTVSNSLFIETYNEEQASGTILLQYVGHAEEVGVRLLESRFDDTFNLTLVAITENVYTVEINVLKPLDREAKEFYCLTVVATDTVLTSYAMLFLMINDINDNSPIFQNTPYLASVVEESGFETETGIVVFATDEDKDAFGTVTYAFQQNVGSKFNIDDMTGVITAVAGIDREEQFLYILTVEARDGGGNVETTTVTITIEDINDEKPEFTGPFSEVIPENFPLGQVVTTVTATDRDEEGSINSRITYSFDLASSDVPFSIEGSTGKIRTVRSLDFDTEPKSYQLVVFAIDGGVNPMESSTTVTITLTDINDCTPTFSSPSSTYPLREGTQAASVVANITAEDCDSGDNSRLVYSIPRGNEAGMFTINNGVILVAQGADIDYEETKVFTLTVVAQDNGTMPLSSSTEIILNIIDINDNDPVFMELEEVVNIPESTNSETVIFSVSATDLDSGQNGQISYRIESSTAPSGTFSINPSTGTVTLLQMVDRDPLNCDMANPVRDQYNLTIKAEDFGGRFSTVVVVVQITDTNDNSPQFGDGLDRTCTTRVSIEEGSSIGRSVFNVTASDCDGANFNSLLQYDIIGGNTNQTFDISETGEIAVASSPDREVTSLYELIIEVSDNGNPKLNVDACLSIKISDINDEAPKFAETNYAAEVLENKERARIVNLFASDVDEGSNAEITMRFCENYTDFELVNEGSGSGYITNKEPLDCERESFYILCLVASNDNGSPPLSSSATVSITVTDVNDNMPVLFGDCSATISELEKPGGIITLYANDSDCNQDSNGAIRWENTPGSSIFRIDASSGEIELQNSQSLDYEVKPVHKFNLTLADLGAPAETVIVQCTIALTDENDNPPIFSQKEYYASIEENTNITMMSEGFLQNLVAFDADEHPYNITSYSIIDWSPESDVSDLFIINGQDLYVTGRLDREASPQYMVNVRATNDETGYCPNESGGFDECDPFSDVKVIINVGDVNDNAPYFTEDFYTSDVPSVSGVGYTVKSLVAMDLDYETNAKVVYSLNEPSEIRPGTFTIDTVCPTADACMGIVTTAGPVERYEGATFNITVIARDLDGKTGYNEASVNITVTVIGDIQKVCLTYGCEENTVRNSKDDLISILSRITDFIISEPSILETGDSISEVCFSAQNNVTNKLVSFDDLEEILFENFIGLSSVISSCPLISIKSPGRQEVTIALSSVTNLIPLFALCIIVGTGGAIMLFLGFNQRRATRQRKKKEYQSNMLFHGGTDISRDLIQLENVQGADEITHENPMFIDPFNKWKNTDASQEPSHTDTAATLQRGNPIYESQEIRMEMFQDHALSEDGDEGHLLQQALDEDSDDEDILVTAI